MNQRGSSRRAASGLRTSSAPDRRAAAQTFADPDDFRDFFKAHYGPTVAAYRGLVGDPERVAALDRDLSDLARRHDRNHPDSGGSTVMDWEYLLVTASRR